MREKSKILIADDEEINRKILAKILENDYDIVEAEDGEKALNMLLKPGNDISAVILDLIMPNVDGIKFLEECSKVPELGAIPVIVSTGDGSEEREEQCLGLGAWDFIRKPYRASIILFRVKNVIERSQFKILKELQYLQQFDKLTGLYRKEKFIQKTAKMLREHSNQKFVLIHFDICKFKTFNAVFGLSEGDDLLCFIADTLREHEKEFAYMTYGRIDNDIFLICQPYKDENSIVKFFKDFKKKLDGFKQNYDISLNFGIYEISEMNDDVYAMIDKAKLAAQQSKGNYVKNYAYYTEWMSDAVLREQEIVSGVRQAMENDEFVLYLQPKYELIGDSVEGAEVLVRWKKADGSMVPPGDFIPLFEKNGFIMELDYYIWEKTCKLLRKWIDEGRSPFPVSVNVSRISIYNPNLVRDICDLVEKYQIPHELFQLELTESAYTNNPEAIRNAMKRLQENGFRILMDDFGSGYSSLNVLKDISVDVLKIDMKFLTKSVYPGRGENILASIVRMAKWIDMQVIAEGVETVEQVDFLRSIGCEFVQGYYFARPMPVEAYEQLVFGEFGFKKDEEPLVHTNMNSIWDTNGEMNVLFSEMLQAVAIYEYEEGKIDVIRVNNSYYDMFGYENLNRFNNQLMDVMDADCRQKVKACFEKLVKNKGSAECEYTRTSASGRKVRVSTKLKYISTVGKKHVIFGTIYDITRQKENDIELRKYRAALLAATKEQQTILVVDDDKDSRDKLEKLLCDRCNVRLAKNGKEAFEIMKSADNVIDLILLDIKMPVMDGMTFLKKKNNDSEVKNIPVVVITADNTMQQQINMLQMGVSDYIVKPFVEEIVARRIYNVLDSARHFNELLKEYNRRIDISRVDDVTGFFRSESATEAMNDALSGLCEKMAFIKMKMKNLSHIEKYQGMGICNESVAEFADCLKKLFRQSDIISRYAYDMMLVLVTDEVSEPEIENVVDIIKENVEFMPANRRIELDIKITYVESSEVRLNDLL